MDLTIANLIKDAADSLSLEMEVHEDYSGRNMYGALTTALTMAHPLALAAAVGQAVLVAEKASWEEGPTILPGRIIDEVAGLRSDDFGHSIIIY